jgi:hypothetical protein
MQRATTASHARSPCGRKTATGNRGRSAAKRVVYGKHVCQFSAWTPVPWTRASRTMDYFPVPWTPPFPECSAHCASIQRRSSAAPRRPLLAGVIPLVLYCLVLVQRGEVARQLVVVYLHDEWDVDVNRAKSGAEMQCVRTGVIRLLRQSTCSAQRSFHISAAATAPTTFLNARRRQLAQQ